MQGGELPKIATTAGTGSRFAPVDGARSDIADLLGEMISAHAPDGTYRYASAAARELFGYQPEELVGSWAYDHIHPDDVSRVTIAHRNVLEGSPHTIAYRMRRSDGGYRWVETTTRTLYEEGGEEVAEILCCTRAVADREAIARANGEENEARLERVQKVLAEEGITPHFQPIAELPSGRLIAYEALARFPGDPAYGPDRWFADAWEVGLGVPLELLAVRKAATAGSRLPDEVGLCINVSHPTVSSPAFMGSLGDRADRITIELTEHAAIEDYDGFRRALRPFRATGGRTAVDDFGAGFASLGHILRVDPQWIKLDISLTERVAENSVAHSLATALVAFAEENGIDVIAEGVETVEEVDALTEIGIRYGQGFHLGMPAPLEEALDSAP